MTLITLLDEWKTITKNVKAEKCQKSTHNQKCFPDYSLNIHDNKGHERGVTHMNTLASERYEQSWI